MSAGDCTNLSPRSLRACAMQWGIIRHGPRVRYARVRRVYPPRKTQSRFAGRHCHRSAQSRYGKHTFHLSWPHAYLVTDSKTTCPPPSSMRTPLFIWGSTAFCPQSCGFAIPLYKFQSHRSSLERWCDSLEIFDHLPASPPAKATTTDGSNSPHPKGLKAWWIAENLKSLDGLPALQLAHQAPAVPSNTFNRNAPPKYGMMVRVAGDVSEDVGTEGASSPNNDELNEASGFECKDKDKGRAEGNTRTNNAKQGIPREVILERGRSENLKVLGAFVLGVFATLAYFKLAEALVAPARYLVSVHI